MRSANRWFAQANPQIVRESILCALRLAQSRIEWAIHGLLCVAWIHALCCAIHGLPESMLCAQHIHRWARSFFFFLFNILHPCWGVIRTGSGQRWSLDEGVAPPPEGMSPDMPPAGIATPVLWPSFPMGAGPCCGMTGWGRCWGYLCWV